MRSRIFLGEGGKVIWRNPDLTVFSLMMASLKLVGSIEQLFLKSFEPNSGEKTTIFLYSNAGQELDPQVGWQGLLGHGEDFDVLLLGGGGAHDGLVGSADDDEGVNI